MSITMIERKAYIIVNEAGKFAGLRKWHRFTDDFSDAMLFNTYRGANQSLLWIANNRHRPIEERKLTIKEVKVTLDG